MMVGDEFYPQSAFSNKLPWLIVAVLLLVLYAWKKEDEKYYMRSVMCEGNKCRLTKARDVPWQKGEPMPAF